MFLFHLLILFLLLSLVVLLMFIYIRIRGQSWMLEPLSMCLWGMVLIRKVTNVIILNPRIFMSPWMLRSVKMHVIFLPPVTPRQGEKSCYYEDLFSGQDGRLASEFLRLECFGTELEKEDSSPPNGEENLGSQLLTSLPDQSDRSVEEEVSDSVLDEILDVTNAVLNSSSVSPSPLVVSPAQSSPEDAMRDEKWMQAMTVKMDALEKNCTWELVSLPPGKKTVGCRWVYIVKHNSDGSVDRYKARLVAKGYTQKYGVDYDETFAPVAKINTIRVYMDLPPGYGTSTGEQVVCRLKKSLYGLKQSPRAWFGRFTKFMKKISYRQSNSDHTLFLKHRCGKVTALIIYVDDMVVTGDDFEEIQRLQGQLSLEFEMKDLGNLKYFLGIEVARGNDCIVLSQRKYVLDLLAETCMLDCQPVDTPIEQNHRLAEYLDQVPTNKARYQRLVGRLIYLSHTRPDLAYAVSVVSQFMHNPSKTHMDAVFRILLYLKFAPGKGLLFSKHIHLDVSRYTNAD
ncbi:putative RNA-directed DNA polymerase [Rosa chinensis]|uniref:Putative RNA-directed DNA polymerase n=1 Tax=Rosa chinensis TaxID=74649 RepID=A0A2P6RZD8_ROSCH|nr:putative RNA-directed DNA polymerase [Rosa chinensis]